MANNKKINSKLDCVNGRWMVCVGNVVKYVDTLEQAFALQDKLMLEAQGRK